MSIFKNFKFSLLLSLGPALLTALARHQYFCCKKYSLPLLVCVKCVNVNSNLLSNTNYGMKIYKEHLLNNRTYIKHGQSEHGK